MARSVDQTTLDRLILLLEKQASERPVSRIINNPMTYVGGLSVLIMVILSMTVFIYNINQTTINNRLDNNEKNTKDMVALVRELQTSQLLINESVKQNYEATKKNTETVSKLTINAAKYDKIEEEFDKIWKELDKWQIFMDDVKDFMRDQKNE